MPLNQLHLQFIFITENTIAILRNKAFGQAALTIITIYKGLARYYNTLESKKYLNCRNVRLIDSRTVDSVYQ